MLNICLKTVINFLQDSLLNKYGGRESSTHCNFRKPTYVYVMRPGCRKHMQIEKAAANQENIFISLTTRAANAHNQIKKHTANKILCLVVLWAFAVCFFICLCCEHLQHVLSNWWRCFLDLLLLFLFACVFWSCSALSSLGHCSWTQKKIFWRMLLTRQLPVVDFHSKKKKYIYGNQCLLATVLFVGDLSL